MKYLIIGGCGFIGSNLANYLIKKGERVTVLDNLSRVGSEINLKWLQDKGVKSIRADIVEQNVFNPEEYDVVYLLAAQTAVTHSIDNPQHDFNVNAVGVFNILETIRKSKKKPRLIFASTNKVYGHLVVEKPVNEKFSLDFFTPYGCSKGIGDQYVRDYSRIFGLTTIVLRQSCIYGYRQWGTEDQGWLAWFVLQILRDEPITIFGDGKQVRDLLYIDDLVKLYDNVATSSKIAGKGSIYNVGGGLEYTINLIDAISEIGRLTGKKPKINYEKERPGDQPYYISDNTKAMSAFGWSPEISVDVGLKKLIKWLNNVIIYYKK